MPVNTPHAQYTEYAEIWEKCRDILKGEEQVKYRKEKYLPKLKSMSTEDYNAYRNRARFLEATGRTVDGFTGLMFMKEPSITLPEDRKKFISRATHDGQSLAALAQVIANELLGMGRGGVLIDKGQSGNGSPYAAYYRTEDIINWTYEVDEEGQLRLTHLRLREIEEKQDEHDEFKNDTRTVYRVFDFEDGKLRVRIYATSFGEPNGTPSKQGEDIFPQRIGTNLTEIPFVFLGVTENSPNVERPPLLGLMNINLHHYQLSADYAHGLHFTALPTPVIMGGEEGNDYYIGSSKAWVLPEGGNAKFLEFEGQGLEAIATSLEDLQKQMAVLGARLLESQPNVEESATGVLLRHSGDKSIVQKVVTSTDEAMNDVIRWLLWWDGLEVTDDDERYDFHLTTDIFSVEVSPEKLRVIMEMAVSELISYETFYENLKKANIADGESDAEDELIKISEQEPRGVVPDDSGLNS